MTQEFPCEACVRKPFRTYKELVTHCVRMGDRVHLESVFSESNSDEWVPCKVEGCEYRASRIDFHVKRKHGMTREQYEQKYNAPVLSRKFIERVSNSGRHANDGKDMSGENNPFFGQHHSLESKTYY